MDCGQFIMLSLLLLPPHSLPLPQGVFSICPLATGCSPSEKGCSSMGSLWGHSKPAPPQAPLSTGPAKSLIQCGLPQGQRLLWEHPLAPSRAPSQAAGGSLLHPGLLLRLQEDLCSIIDSHGLQGISAPAPGAPPASPPSLPSCLQGCSSPMLPLLSLAAVALTLTRLFLPSQIRDPSSALPCG